MPCYRETPFSATRGVVMDAVSQRHFSRSDCCLPIKFARSEDRHYCESTLYNISRTGMYFESAEAVRPQSNVQIIMPKPSPSAPESGEYQYYAGQIMWCRRVQGKSGACFGCGIRLSKCGQQADGEDAHLICQLCDMCNEATPCDEIETIDCHIYLCPSCFSYLSALPDGQLKSAVIRFLKGNVI